MLVLLPSFLKHLPRSHSLVGDFTISRNPIAVSEALASQGSPGCLFPPFTSEPAKWGWTLHCRDTNIIENVIEAENTLDPLSWGIEMASLKAMAQYFLRSCLNALNVEDTLHIWLWPFQGPKQHRKSVRDTGYYSICCTAKSYALSTPQTFSDHNPQQTAAHGHGLSHLKALVLGNGLLHAVLLIGWDHAHAGLHGPHRATKAREEGFHGSRCLGREFILNSFLGCLVHGTSHSAHHASHSESNRSREKARRECWSKAASPGLCDLGSKKTNHNICHPWISIFCLQVHWVFLSLFSFAQCFILATY